MDTRSKAKASMDDSVVIDISDSDGDENLDTPKKKKNENEDIILNYPNKKTGAITLTKLDYGCLSKKEYLNDRIIEFYLKYLLEAVVKPNEKNNYYYFPTFFFEKLRAVTKKSDLNKNFNDAEKIEHLQQKFESVKRWTKNVNIFQKKYVFIPINDPEYFEEEELNEVPHWYLAVICNLDLIDSNVKVTKNKSSDGSQGSSPEGVKIPCILIFDSLRTSRSGAQKLALFKILWDYLTFEYYEKFTKVKIFERANMKAHYPRAPEQYNDYDCGVYLLQYAEQLIKHPIKNFILPLKLEKWFPIDKIKDKRLNVSLLIKKLMIAQNPGRNKVELLSILPKLKLHPNNKKITKPSEKVNISDMLFKDNENNENLLSNLKLSLAKKLDEKINPNNGETSTSTAVTEKDDSNCSTKQKTDAVAQQSSQEKNEENKAAETQNKTIISSKSNPKFKHLKVYDTVQKLRNEILSKINKSSVEKPVQVSPTKKLVEYDYNSSDSSDDDCEPPTKSTDSKKSSKIIESDSKSELENHSKCKVSQQTKDDKNTNEKLNDKNKNFDFQLKKAKVNQQNKNVSAIRHDKNNKNSDSESENRSKCKDNQRNKDGKNTSEMCHSKIHKNSESELDNRSKSKGNQQNNDDKSANEKRSDKINKNSDSESENGSKCKVYQQSKDDKNAGEILHHETNKNFHSKDENHSKSKVNQQNKDGENANEKRNDKTNTNPDSESVNHSECKVNQQNKDDKNTTEMCHDKNNKTPKSKHIKTTEESISTKIDLTFDRKKSSISPKILDFTCDYNTDKQQSGKINKDEMSPDIFDDIFNNITLRNKRNKETSKITSPVFISDSDKEASKSVLVTVKHPKETKDDVFKNITIRNNVDKKTIKKTTSPDIISNSKSDSNTSKSVLVSSKQPKEKKEDNFKNTTIRNKRDKETIKRTTSPDIISCSESDNNTSKSVLVSSMQQKYSKLNKVTKDRQRKIETTSKNDILKLNTEKKHLKNTIYVNDKSSKQESGTSSAEIISESSSDIDLFTSSREMKRKKRKKEATKNKDAKTVSNCGKFDKLVNKKTSTNISNRHQTNAIELKEIEDIDLTNDFSSNISEGCNKDKEQDRHKSEIIVCSDSDGSEVTLAEVKHKIKSSNSSFSESTINKNTNDNASILQNILETKLLNNKLSIKSNFSLSSKRTRSSSSDQESKNTKLIKIDLIDAPCHSKTVKNHDGIKQSTVQSDKNLSENPGKSHTNIHFSSKHKNKKKSKHKHKKQSRDSKSKHKRLENHEKSDLRDKSESPKTVNSDSSSQSSSASLKNEINKSRRSLPTNSRSSTSLKSVMSKSRSSLLTQQELEKQINQRIAQVIIKPSEAIQCLESKRDRILFYEQNQSKIKRWKLSLRNKEEESRKKDTAVITKRVKPILTPQ